MSLIEVDIDIEDYLGEVDTSDLLEELESRDDFFLGDFSFDFKTPKQQYEAVKKVLGLREFHDKERALRELQELLVMI